MGNVLYLDIFFINNLVMDLLLLVTAVSLSRRPVRLFRCILGAITGAMYSCLEILFLGSTGKLHSMNGILSMLMTGFLMAVLVWYGRGLRECARGMLFLYITSFLISGILTVLSGYLKKQWILVVLTGCAVFGCVKTLKKEKSMETMMRQVTIFHHGKEKTYIGLLDTGNSLTDPVSKVPVHVMSKEGLRYFMPEGWEKERVKIIPYNTISNSDGILTAIVIDQMTIRDTAEKKQTIRGAVVAMSEKDFSKRVPYQILLNPLVLSSYADRMEMEKKNEGKIKSKL